MPTETVGAYDLGEIRKAAELDYRTPDLPIAADDAVDLSTPVTDPLQATDRKQTVAVQLAFNGGGDSCNATLVVYVKKKAGTLEPMSRETTQTPLAPSVAPENFQTGATELWSIVELFDVGAGALWEVRLTNVTGSITRFKAWAF